MLGIIEKGEAKKGYGLAVEEATRSLILFKNRQVYETDLAAAKKDCKRPHRNALNAVRPARLRLGRNPDLRVNSRIILKPFHEKTLRTTMSRGTS